MQGDIGNLDQDIPHLSPVLHLAGFETAELLLQLFDNGRDADIMNAGNRAVDGDRYLRGTVFNGRLDIVKSRQTGDPSFTSSVIDAISSSSSPFTSTTMGLLRFPKGS